MVDIIGVIYDTKINAFTDYKKHGLDYVCERVYKYNDFVKLMRSNERLEFYIFKKLLNIGVIKKTGRIECIKTDTYGTVLPKKVRKNMGINCEDDYDRKTFDNKVKLNDYLMELTTYDGDEYIYDLLDKYNNYKNWIKKLKNTHNELIIKFYHKEKLINYVVKNNAYKKTNLYKELRRRKREKSPPKIRKRRFEDYY